LGLLSFRFESGTVGSGEKSIQDVHPADYVGMVRMTTTQTQENIPLGSISPLGVTTCRAPLTRVRRRNRSENNTVVFTSPFDPAQPVTVNPCTKRSSHTSRQATSDLGILVHVLETFNDQEPKISVGPENLPYHLVHALLQRASQGLLAFTSPLAPLDGLQNLPNIESKQPTNRSSSKYPHPGVQPQIHPLGFLGTGLDLKGKLDVILGDDVGLLPSASGLKAVEVTMELDGKIETDLVPDGGQDQPSVKLGSLFRLFEASDGARDVHPFTSMSWFDGLVSPSFLGGLAHVNGLAGRDLAEPSRHPSLGSWEIDDGLEEFPFGRDAVGPEVVDEKVDDPAILSEDFAELGPFVLRGELEGALARSLDLHELKSLYHGLLNPDFLSLLRFT